ncbi:hypothetical protein ACT29H_08710 [Thermophagus sp. OGC60D27]|uniref:hypothetical protein n=1 Tax=Thermophagus sp. OGC60D27 TaxID=3458415 RepID=UPI004037CF7B
MRNYSEIGCITLLGVTLTVSVTVGQYHNAVLLPEGSAKNILLQPTDDLAENEKLYYVSISCSTRKQNASVVLPLFRSLHLPDYSAAIDLRSPGILLVKTSPAPNVFGGLPASPPTLLNRRTNSQHFRTACDGLPKHHWYSSSLAIRAGPTSRYL